MKESKKIGLETFSKRLKKKKDLITIMIHSFKEKYLSGETVYFLSYMFYRKKKPL